ncbi:hypothetical protein PDJAM_G00266090 [Pangasius djambal]|nr:hypothetical protein [Pangasius djambal]
MLQVCIGLRFLENCVVMSVLIVCTVVCLGNVCLSLRFVWPKRGLRSLPCSVATCLS